MPLRLITRLISSAVEREQEKRTWQMYLMKYQNMNQETYRPYADFYKKPGRRTIDNGTQKTKEEIISDAETILASLRMSKMKGG